MLKNKAKEQKETQKKSRGNKKKKKKKKKNTAVKLNPVESSLHELDR